MDTTYAATVLVLLVFVASVISVEAALSAAIIEIVLGVAAANFLGMHPAPWMDFIAGFGGILLTFLAGIEVDQDILRQKLKESLLIGCSSFLVPCVAAMAFCYWVAGWSGPASAIAGCTLSTTSLAVVYAVLVETGLSRTALGKILMASTFVTNMCTVIALSLLFAQWDARTFLALAACAAVIVAVPRWLPGLFERYRAKVIEPEIKFVFFLLFAFMSIGVWGRVHAVLPVFVLGVCLSAFFRTHREIQRKLRMAAFAMITPFFFIKGGMSVSLPDLAAHWPMLLVLFLLKTGSKFAGVWPFAKRYAGGHTAYLTLLMSTGLTFGNITAMYGLQAGHITSTQFSLLIGTVICAAIIPTVIAQQWFSPALSEEEKEELLAQEEESL